MRKTILLLSAIIIAFSSCQKNNAPAPAKVPSSDLRNLPSATTAVTPGTDIYVAGSYQPNPMINGVAAYWKNGTLVSLNDGFGLEDIAVSGDDVYVAGSAFVSPFQHAAYWKNGVIHNLNFGTSTTFNSVAHGVVVNGSDVYIVGEYTDLSNGSNNITKPILWKNGVAQDLSYNSFPGIASAIAISGSDVYITGFSSLSSNSTRIATVWKNGVATKIASSSINSWGKDIAVNGSDVYVAGYTSPAANTSMAAVYWKNGVLNPIRSNAEAAAIAINSNNVYVAGLAFYSDGTNQAVSWKNGVASVYGPLNTLQIMDIAISGSDTYALAQSGFLGGSYNSYYYKNGAAYLVSYGAIGVRMLVVQH